MSGFVAGNSTPAEHKIENAAFWPELDCNALRAAMRLDSSVTADRLETATIHAMIEVNRELDGYRQRQEQQGHTSLATVPAQHIAGKSQLLHLYLRAVYCRTAAELVERYRSYDTTNSGSDKADEDITTVDELRRDSRHAIRSILGISHTTVELL